MGLAKGIVLRQWNYTDVVEDIVLPSEPLFLVGMSKLE